MPVNVSGQFRLQRASYFTQFIKIERKVGTLLPHCVISTARRDSFKPSVWNYNCHAVVVCTVYVLRVGREDRRRDFLLRKNISCLVSCERVKDCSLIHTIRLRYKKKQGTINCFRTKCQQEFRLRLLQTVLILKRSISSATVIGHSSCSLFSHRPPMCRASNSGHLSFSGCEMLQFELSYGSDAKLYVFLFWQ